MIKTQAYEGRSSRVSLTMENYIYVGTKSTQGAKTGQISLIGQFSEHGAALSTEFIQTGTVSVPKALSAVFHSNVFKTICIQRILEQKLMLAGSPDTQPSNPIQMHSGQWLNRSGVKPIHLYRLILWRDITRTPVSNTSRRGNLSWKISCRIWSVIWSCWKNSYGREGIRECEHIRRGAHLTLS